MRKLAEDLLDRFARRNNNAAGEQIQASLRQHSEPLPALDTDAFGELFDRYGDARVVLIGEASHGTSEFYRTGTAITRRLIERHASASWRSKPTGRMPRKWTDVYATCQAGPRRPRHSRASGAGCGETPRSPNSAAGCMVITAGWPADRVECPGLDVCSMRSSFGDVLSYFNDPDMAHEARQRYGCLTPWQDEPALYGHFVFRSANEQNRKSGRDWNLNRGVRRSQNAFLVAYLVTSRRRCWSQCMWGRSIVNCPHCSPQIPDENPACSRRRQPEAWHGIHRAA